jgi:hypothetical protein
MSVRARSERSKVVQSMELTLVRTSGDKHRARVPCQRESDALGKLRPVGAAHSRGEARASQQPHDRRIDEV